MESETVSSFRLEQMYKYLAQGGGQNIRSFSYKSRHRHIDLVKLDTLCPNLKELTVSDSIMVYKPGNSMVVDIKSFSNLRYLTVKDVIMEGDQACWKRLIKRCSGLVCLTLQSISLTEVSVYKLIEKCPRLRKIGGICCWSAQDMVGLLEQLSSRHHFKIRMDDRE